LERHLERTGDLVIFPFNYKELCSCPFDSTSLRISCFFGLQAETKLSEKKNYLP